MATILGKASGGGHTDQYRIALNMDLIVATGVSRWSSDHIVFGEGGVPA